MLGCCLVLAAIHALRQGLSTSADDALIANFAFVPARLAIALGVAQDQIRLAYQTIPQEGIRYVLGDGGSKLWSLLTYALLHGTWSHLLFNCVWLASFGSPVARRCGAARFLILMALSTLVGALVQFAASPASFIPVIGASGAVAGAMGAAARFVFRPMAEADDPHLAGLPPLARPALSLPRTLRTGAALGFILVWFVTNVVFGLFPELVGMNDGPIAWQAHIGGFLVGLLAFDLFDRRDRHAATLLEEEDSADVPLS